MVAVVAGCEQTKSALCLFLGISRPRLHRRCQTGLAGVVSTTVLDDSWTSDALVQHVRLCGYRRGYVVVSVYLAEPRSTQDLPFHFVNLCVLLTCRKSRIHSFRSILAPCRFPAMKLQFECNSKIHRHKNCPGSLFPSAAVPHLWRPCVSFLRPKLPKRVLQPNLE